MMTIKVYRMRPDGTRFPIAGLRTVRPTEPDKLPLSLGFPPCRCLLCADPVRSLPPSSLPAASPPPASAPLGTASPDLPPHNDRPPACPTRFRP
ncbi:hypothetical protein GCM10028832_17030 [Streptomyces sparsus]